MTLTFYMEQGQRLFGRERVREWLREATNESFEKGIKKPEEIMLYFEETIGKKYRAAIEEHKLHLQLV